MRRQYNKKTHLSSVFSFERDKSRPYNIIDEPHPHIMMNYPYNIMLYPIPT